MKKLLGVGFMMALAVSAVNCLAGEDKPPQMGEPSPSFEAMDLAKKVYRSSQLRNDGQALVIFFWSLRSAPCLQEMAFMEKNYSAYKAKGVVILAVEGSGKSADQIVDHLEQLKEINLRPSFPLIPDPEGTLSRLFGVKKVPQTFLVNQSGVIAYHLQSFSGLAESLLLGMLDEVLQPKPMEVVKAPPVPAPVIEVKAPVEQPSFNLLDEAPSVVKKMKEAIRKKESVDNVDLSRPSEKKLPPRVSPTTPLETQEAPSVLRRIQGGNTEVESRRPPAVAKPASLEPAPSPNPKAAEEAPSVLRRIQGGDTEAESGMTSAVAKAAPPEWPPSPNPKAAEEAPSVLRRIQGGDTEVEAKTSPAVDKMGPFPPPPRPNAKAVDEAPSVLRRIQGGNSEVKSRPPPAVAEVATPPRVAARATEEAPSVLRRIQTGEPEVASRPPGAVAEIAPTAPPTRPARKETEEAPSVLRRIQGGDPEEEYQTPPAVAEGAAPAPPTSPTPEEADEAPSVLRRIQEGDPEEEHEPPPVVAEVAAPAPPAPPPSSASSAVDEAPSVLRRMEETALDVEESRDRENAATAMTTRAMASDYGKVIEAEETDGPASSKAQPELTKAELASGEAPSVLQSDKLTTLERERSEGDAHYQAREWGAAIPHYEKCLSFAASNMLSDEDQIYYHEQLDQSYEKEKEYSMARWHLERILALRLKRNEEDAEVSDRLDALIYKGY